MEQIIETLSSDPLYIAVAALLAALLVVSVLKQVLRVALVAMVALVVFGFYLDATGKEADHEAIREVLVDKSAKISKKLQENLSARGEKAAEAIREVIAGEATDAAKEFAEKAGDAAKALGDDVQEQAGKIKNEVKRRLNTENSDN